MQAPPLCSLTREDRSCRAAGTELAALLGPGSQQVRRTHCQQRACIARRSMLFCCPSYQVPPSSMMGWCICQGKTKWQWAGPNQVIRYSTKQFDLGESYARQ